MAYEVSGKGGSTMSDELKIRLGRRQFLLATAGLAGATLLAACGGDDDDDDDTTDEGGSGTDATATPEAESGGEATSAATEAEAGDEGEDAEEPEEDATPQDSGSAEEGEPKTGGILLVGQDFGPQELDPTISSARASTNVQEFLFTCLLRWTADMELEPDLATDWEISDDGMIYTFNLREGISFHNGKPFAAEDVQFTFERILDPAVASPRISMFSAIESIETPSETQVVFNLANPVAPFLRNIATHPNGSIVPSGATDDELNDQAPGTGPFRLVEHVLDQEVVMEKFADYYEEGLPYLDGVTMKLLGDDVSISAALRDETVHLAWLKDPKVADNLGQSTEGLTSYPGVASRYLPIHFDLAEPPFNDVNVRRAMSLALDRQQVVDVVLGEYGAVGTFLPPSQLAGYEGDGSDLPYYTRNIEQAKTLLQEAGHDGLDVPEFKVVAANSLDVQAAQVMAQQWAEAGINVTINPMEVGAILEDWNAGNFKMAMVSASWLPDPSNEADRFHSESPRGKSMKINDPELDALVEQGVAETDPDARVEIYKQIEQYALEQVYIIVPYVYGWRWELVWDYVKGYDVMPSNARISTRKTWLDV